MTVQNTRCVYTTLIGSYESLNEQPVAASSAVPFICLTDDPSLQSETWQVVQVPTTFPMDPIRSQRLLKLGAHRITALADFDASLYIDNSVILKARPEEIFEKMPWKSGMGIALHSFRATVHDEFLEVARLGLDDQSRIFEQLNHYLITHEEVLCKQPLWGAILLRDHQNAHVRDAMDIWAAHVLRYSRRDQLSLHVALHMSHLSADVWTLDNHDSWFHRWPQVPGRASFGGARLPMNSMMPAATRVRDLECRSTQQLSSIAVLQEANKLASAKALESEQGLANLNAQIDQLSAANSKLTTDMKLLQADRLHVQQDLIATIEAIHSSTSWRLSSPLRKLKNWLS